MTTFSDTKPHLADTGKGVRSWLIQPAGMLTQLEPGTFLDVDIAMFISTTVDAAMRGRFVGAKQFLYVHDFSKASGYSTHARQILTTWAQSSPATTDKIVIIPPDSAVFKMGITTMQMMLRAGGVAVLMLDSLREAVHRFRIKPV